MVKTAGIVDAAHADVPADAIVDDAGAGTYICAVCGANVCVLCDAHICDVCGATVDVYAGVNECAVCGAYVCAKDAHANPSA